MVGKNKKKEKIDDSFVKSLARLIDDDKKFDKRNFSSGNDVLKERYDCCILLERDTKY